MTLKVGDTIPSGTFGYAKVTEEDDLMTCQRPGQVTTDSWKGKKIVLFGIPGSFTPTCAEKHLPPFIQYAQKLQDMGVSDVYCLATNDLFVQAAFAKASKAGDKVKFISDSSAKWLEEAGLTTDLSSMGLGIRAQRFAMIVDDLKVTFIGVEEGAGDLSVSSVEEVMKNL